MTPAQRQHLALMIAETTADLHHAREVRALRADLEVLLAAMTPQVSLDARVSAVLTAAAADYLGSIGRTEPSTWALWDLMATFAPLLAHGSPHPFEGGMFVVLPEETPHGT